MPEFMKKTEFEAIVLFKLYEIANGDGAPQALDGVAALFKLPVPTHRLKLALDELYEREFVDYTVIGNRNFHFIKNKGLSHIEAMLDKPDSILSRYLLEGEEWAVSRLSGFAPGADRVVRFDHNKPPASEIFTDLENIRVALRTDNEVGNAFGDEKQVALSEIESIAALVEGDAVRPKTFLNLSNRVLSWIAEKGVGTIIAELAKIAFKHIVEWFG